MSPGDHKLTLQAVGATRTGRVDLRVTDGKNVDNVYFDNGQQHGVLAIALRAMSQKQQVVLHFDLDGDPDGIYITP